MLLGWASCPVLHHPQQHFIAETHPLLLQVSKFYYQTESNPGRICQPSILLVTEVYTERKALLLYPINLLRNLARLMVGACTVISI
jgi:hypothetical protein